MIRILVADDHAVLRQGLVRVLEFAPDLQVADEARNGREVLALTASREYDLLLLDLGMPSPSGIELVKRVHDACPSLPILVFTVHDEPELAGRAIRAGAAGYLTKDSEPDVLIEAIRTLARGGHYVAPAIAAKLLFAPAASEALPHQRLSDREFQVFRLLAHGHGISEIAESLHISPKTVSTHKFRVLQKLGLRTEGELVRYALKHSLAN